ncbi:hypothetical protein D3C73_913250 [compost metagenome]
MKLTNFALIFIGVTLPIIIIVYVNVSYTIKAEEQEMYYETVINSAIQDATSQMKEVENNDKSIDYGYSGLWNNKVSVNSQLAVDTFFNSLYNNFDIKGNASAESYMQLFIPAVAIVDYNGVQVSSMEQYTDTSGNIIKNHILKPKKYYSYSYVIDGKNVSDLDGFTGNYDSVHTVEFTMDDYIVHRSSSKLLGNTTTKGFFTSDNLNNSDLISGVSGTLGDADRTALKNKVIGLLQSKRKQIISETVMNEMNYAVNRNNSFAKASGINYDFTFPDYAKEDWYSSVENIGIIAFVQGLSIGNKYLDYHAYGLASLTLATKYYLTTPGPNSKIQMNLYHSDRTCPEYRASTHMETPAFATSKQEAASMFSLSNGVTYRGFYPCPICKP